MLVRNVQIGTTYGKQWKRERTGDGTAVSSLLGVEGVHGRCGKGLRARVRVAGRSVKEE